MAPFKSCGITHIGLCRQNNEDAFAAMEDKRFFVLADGMGGHQAGEVAALTALESLCDSIRSSPPMSLEKSCFFLRSAMHQANARVLHTAASHHAYTGMGTTLSCFLCTEHHLVYAHIGDSRLYRYRNRLSQLTQDHSLRRKSGSKSILYRNHHIITRAIGTHTVILPDMGVIPIHSNDLYMLCSDGLSDYVPEETLAALLGSPLPLHDKAEALVQTALEKGGRDNITLLLVHVT